MHSNKILFQNNKQKLFFILVSLLVFMNSLNPIDDYNFTHWLFNYKFQFIKRGFIGQIFYIFNIHPTLEIVYFSSYLILFIMFYVYIKFFYNAIKPFNGEQGSFLFFLIAVFHSATLQHYHYDIGRFDQIGIIVTLVLISCLKKISDLFQLIIVTLTFIILILIHEALFIMFGPLILLYWINLKKNNTNFTLLKIITFICLGTATLFVSTFGIMKKISAENYFELLLKDYGNKIDKSAVLTLYRNFSDNLEFTHNIGYSIGHHVLMLIVVLPVIFISSVLFYKYFHKVISISHKIMSYLLLISALSPLLLYPIAVDRFRWISITITNLLIVIAIQMQDSKFKLEVINTVEKYKMVIYTTLMASLLLGPLEVGLSFSNNPSFKFLTKLFGLNV